MTTAVIGAEAEKALRILSRLNFLRSFYLAGGTGCALHIGHRLSHDFDFFSPDEFDVFTVQNTLRNQGRFVIDYSDADTMTGRFEGTKISLFRYAYPMLEEPVDHLSVRLASLADIGCMKIDAISSRGTKRDFVDLFFILKNLGLDLKAFFGSFERKYGPCGFNRYHVLKSLVYFDDADKEPEPEMLVDFSWSATKRFFVESVRAFGPP
ncbi:MAG: nucleotidyl transferase AbiEii/AbiGii toxin family protein [Acidobacteriota bacterium]|nr:nucleotidyl transferase AbiEii/AbiGii toxin family protein [Acidobacteriota bacterium]